MQTGRMEGYGIASYGAAFADVYDQWYPGVTDTDGCVRRLAALVPPGGRVLELGVGTGRLAIPLAEEGSTRGVTVAGVDASRPMLERLAAKDGGDRVTVVVGDMAALETAEPPLPAPPEGAAFQLAFVAYNTLFNVVDPEAQRRLVAGVGQRLAPGGRFVVEAFVPRDDHETLDRVAVRSLGADELVLTATVHDPAAQTITGQHVQITEAGIRLRPWMIRYLRPTQIDQLAEAAGLVLEHQWSDWDRRPFDEHSPTRVAVYVRPT